MHSDVKIFGSWFRSSHLRIASLLCFLLPCSAVSWCATTANVLLYGAKGDGITDDTAALVKASTAVAAGGGTLYFPAGTYLINPALGHIVLGNNMTLTGSATIKVKPGSGDFEYILGAANPTSFIENVKIQGLTIDENVLNNTSTPSSIAGRRQIVVAGYGLVDLSIQNATMLISGVDAIIGSAGLVVQNSHFTFQKRSTTPWFDNSALYTNASHSQCSITGNTFTGATTGAQTAIELHHTGTSCVISGNKIDNYVTGVIGADSYALQVASNTITHAQYAVALWSQWAMSNVSVTGNSISLNNLDRQSLAAAGVGLYWCTNCTMHGWFQNIAIENNTITFQPEVRSNVAASSYWGIGAMPAGNVDQLSIKGNTIVNAPLRGIKIGNPFTWHPYVVNTVSNVVVQNNTLINPGNNTALWWYEAAIALEGNLNAVTISANTIKNTSVPFTGHYAFWTNPQGSYSGVTLEGNTLDPQYVSAVSAPILFR